MLLTKTQTTTNKRQPSAAASFTLMSSEHKLLLANSTTIEIDATNNCATLSKAAESEPVPVAVSESKCYTERCQQTLPRFNCCSANRRTSSIATTKGRRRRCHRHHCSAHDHDGTTAAAAVKPKSIVLTNHLVNSLMTLLYFIAFLSLSTYPVYVSAVGEYHTAQQLSIIILNSRKTKKKKQKTNSVAACRLALSNINFNLDSAYSLMTDESVVNGPN